MTQYQLDLQRPLNINGAQSSRAFYNLVISIRDVSLFSKGIKPYRGWRITDVKNYFGVKGNPAKVLIQLQALKEDLVS